MKKQNVVVVGGGTGTHTVLKGLRQYADEIAIAAVVSMADSGGSTGRLRDEFGMLPVGDVRNALTALAADGDENETLLRQLFMYRFDRGDGLSGHNFGNLFLTALTDMLGSEVAAIEAASRILKAAGRVIPVTTDTTDLVAEYDTGAVVVGEDTIDAALSCAPDARIVTLSLSPSATITREAAEAIEAADLLVFGPGDLYTSILPNCIVEGFVGAVAKSQATVVYVCNLMSKHGQTTGMHAAEHIAEIARHIGRAPDITLINSAPFRDDLVSKYGAEGDHPILNNCSDDMCVIEAQPLVSLEEVVLRSGDVLKRSLIRHDSAVLAAALMTILRNR